MPINAGVSSDFKETFFRDPLLAWDAVSDY